MNECKPDPWTLCVSPDHFAEQMEVLSKLTPRPVVTFDDGYADNLHNALPILEHYGVAAKIFVISGAVGSEVEMWWDALDQIYDPPQYFEAFDKIRPLRSIGQRQEVERLFAAAQMACRFRDDRRMLTAQELNELARSPLIEIGAHTVSHPVLSLLTPAEQLVEIGDSKRALEEALNRRVNGFAYPNGMDPDYSAETIQVVREAGFEYCYSAFEHDHDDLFQLPRVMIRDWDGDEFSALIMSAAGRAGVVLSRT